MWAVSIRLLMAILLIQPIVVHALWALLRVCDRCFLLSPSPPFYKPEEKDKRACRGSNTNYFHEKKYLFSLMRKYFCFTTINSFIHGNNLWKSVSFVYKNQTQ